MIQIVLLASLATLAFAQYGHAPAYGHGAYGHGGAYAHDYAQPTPYQYGYDIAGDHGEFQQTRKEVGDGHGNVQGSYGYVDAHGVQRQVDYVADGHGFRASVKTNEPGTDNQQPADVDIHSQAPHYASGHYDGGYGRGVRGGYGKAVGGGYGLY